MNLGTIYQIIQIGARQQRDWGTRVNNRIRIRFLTTFCSQKGNWGRVLILGEISNGILTTFLFLDRKARRNANKLNRVFFFSSFKFSAIIY